MDPRGSRKHALAVMTMLGLVAATLVGFPAVAAAVSRVPSGLLQAVRGTLGSPQQTELTASDGSAGDRFGWSVAISGTTAVVGSTGKVPNGAAYVFVRTGSVWSQQAELTASDGTDSDAFGAAVAISGSTVVVGAPDKGSFTGAAYVFVRSGSVWSQQAELTASDGASIDYFGTSVAISGNTAVVGAEGKNSFAGAAYVFARKGTVWSQHAELTASDGAPQDSFGHSVAVSGTTTVVGAYAKNFSAGAAYVFVLSNSIWSQQAKLTASDGARTDEFGWSVALAGSTAVVGAMGRSPVGAAYVFVRVAPAWTQQAELTASDGTSDDHFGYAVAISGTTAVVGAPDKNVSAGAAYRFVQSGTVWSQRGKMTAFDGASSDDFGHSVGLSTSIVVGAFGHDASTGAAYVFG